MAELEKLKSTKRFGARYGRSIKYAFAKIEKEQRKLHKCPYCSKEAVKRKAVGIWECRKCGAKFTGKAYSTTELITTKEKKEEENLESNPEIKAESKKE